MKYQKEITEKVNQLTCYLREKIQRMDALELLSPAEGECAGITLVGCEGSKQICDMLRSKGIIVNHRDGIRISLHFYNAFEDVDYLLENISDKIIRV